jgi:hypothetical protein
LTTISCTHAQKMGRTVTLGVLLALGLLGPGCGPYINVARTIIVEPAHFCTSLDALVECRRDKQLAKAAWGGVQAEVPGPGGFHRFRLRVSGRVRGLPLCRGERDPAAAAAALVLAGQV